jgi:hypothetical protein
MCCTTAVSYFKAFAQQGFPAEKIAVPDTAFEYESTIEPAGGAMDGAYSMNQFKSWGQTDDPEIAEYLETMKGSSVDVRAPNVQWGYQLVNFMYAAAEEIGFDDFGAQSLQQFMSTAKGVPVPLSRDLVHPGPQGYPQLRQPWAQIVQYKDDKFTPVEGGEDGWFNGFETDG